LPQADDAARCLRITRDFGCRRLEQQLALFRYLHWRLN
jgi:hypothetical protein